MSQPTVAVGLLPSPAHSQPMVDIANSIAGYLRQAVDSKAILQKDLAEAADISEQAVSKWMKTGKVSLESLVAIADRMKVSIDEIVGRPFPKIESNSAELDITKLAVLEDSTATYSSNIKKIHQLTADRQAILWRILDALLADQKINEPNK